MPNSSNLQSLLNQKLVYLKEVEEWMGRRAHLLKQDGSTLFDEHQFDLTNAEIDKLTNEIERLDKDLRLIESSNQWDHAEIRQLQNTLDKQLKKLQTIHFNTIQRIEKIAEDLGEEISRMRDVKQGLQGYVGAMNSTPRFIDRKS
jgi:predicted  nucleic acid-binding Zn-ribbon protein